MKCPLCGKDMTKMSESAAEAQGRKDEIYYCDRHGVLNKGSDLKEKADKMTKTESKNQ